MANVLAPFVGAGAVTSDQVSAYYAESARTNLVIASTDLPQLLLNPATFSLDAPNLLPQTGSSLLTGAVTGGKLANMFFAAVPYKGAFGTDNWLAGWTNFSPQNTDYDRGQ